MKDWVFAQIVQNDQIMNVNLESKQQKCPLFLSKLQMFNIHLPARLRFITVTLLLKGL